MAGLLMAIKSINMLYLFYVCIFINLLNKISWHTELLISKEQVRLEVYKRLPPLQVYGNFMNCGLLV